MKGNCVDCVHERTCNKTFGIMFGCCSTDFYPIKKMTRAEWEAHMYHYHGMNGQDYIMEADEGGTCLTHVKVVD